jgi:hypothetical protein
MAANVLKLFCGRNLLIFFISNKARVKHLQMLHAKVGSSPCRQTIN